MVTTGWTGGQWSLVRVALGLVLLLLLARRLPEPATAVPLPPGLAVAALGALMVASVLLALGLFDRPAAVFLAATGVLLLWPAHPAASPSLLAMSFVLLAHACLPAAPYGSWAARGRADPGGGWSFPPWIHALAWILLAAGYGSAAVSLLGFRVWGGLLVGVAIALLALRRGARPFLWLALLLLSLVVFIDSDASRALILVHLLAFDPAWVEGTAGGVERIFYDGTCALCHGAVRFVLAEDPEGRAFRFAPLDSAACRDAIPADTRARLPDSLVVAAEGRLLTRSSGVLQVLERLGGLWRLLAFGGRLVPRAVRDAAYDFVARVRYRVFGRKDEACPRIPASLRARFDL